MLVARVINGQSFFLNVAFIARTPRQLLFGLITWKLSVEAVSIGSTWCSVAAVTGAAETTIREVIIVLQGAS